MQTDPLPKGWVREGRWRLANRCGGGILIRASIAYGKLERTIELPLRHPTMCTFGGKDLDMPYVTSGTQFVKEKWAHTQPLAGCLIHDVGARGLPEPFFAG